MLRLAARPDRSRWPLRKVTDPEERLNAIAELSRAAYSIQKVDKPREEEPD